MGPVWVNRNLQELRVRERGKAREVKFELLLSLRQVVDGADMK